MLMVVISGGQSGADIAALRAAQACGLRTGGWMPRGFLTLDGPHPEYATLFGLQEHSSPNYPPRTRRNVQMADATLRFARHWSSHGERATLKFLRQYGKPFRDLDIEFLPPLADVEAWLVSQRVQILNIAGNTEQTAPGIEAIVQPYLETIFRSLQRTMHSTSKDHTTS